MGPSCKLRRPTTASLIGTALAATCAAWYREDAQKRQIEFPSLILLIIVCLFFLFVEPIRQPQSYHDFAEKRCFLCRCGGGMKFLPPDTNADMRRTSTRSRFVIPNFGDVVSNIVIFIGGLSGILSLFWLEISKDHLNNQNPASDDDILLIFFGATIAVSVGSTYYHWNPSDSTLVYDRLPMTVAFAAIFCFMLDEYLPEPPDGLMSTGQVILVPFILLGVTSVIYWSWTDDLRLYAVIAILPILLMPALVICYQPKHTGVTQQVIGLVLYSLAKICEEKDYEIFHLTRGTVSGHSLKHAFAGFAPISIVQMVLVRSNT